MRRLNPTDSFQIRWFRERNGQVEELGPGSYTVQVQEDWLSRYHDTKLWVQPYSPSLLGRYWCQVIKTSVTPHQPLSRSNLFTLLAPEAYTCSNTAMIQTVTNITCADLPVPQHQVISTATQHQVLSTTPQHQVLSTTPQHQVLSTTPQHQVLSTAPQHQVISTTPQHQVLFTTPQHQVLSTAPQHQVLSTAPQHQVLSTAPQHQVISTAPQHQVISTVPHHQVSFTMLDPITTLMLSVPSATLQQQEPSITPQVPTSPTRGQCSTVVIDMHAYTSMRKTKMFIFAFSISL